MLEERFFSLGRYLKKTFGERVNKMSVHIPSSYEKDGDARSYSFCPGGTILSPVAGAEIQPVMEQVESAKERIRQRFKTGKFVIYFHSDPDAKIPLDRFASIVEEVIQDNEVIGINLNLKPEDITDEMIKFLVKTNSYIYMWLEVGMHTIHEETLRRIGLNHTHQQAVDVIRKLHGTRLRIAPHVVLGLPGETEEMMRETMEAAIRMSVQGISIHPMSALKDSPMEKLYSDGQIEMMEKEKYVTLVSDFIEILPSGLVLHKIVGEAGKERLVAPDWVLDKKDTVGLISAELEKRGSTQGCRPLVEESVFEISVDE